MKTRVVTYSKKKKMSLIADAIAAKCECRSDKLPLAYPFDKERLTIFVASVSSPNEDLRVMMPQMDAKLRSANTAFVIDGTPEQAKDYIDAAKAAGTNVIDNVLYVKCGKISFLDSVSDTEKADAAKWAEAVMAAVK